MKKLLVLTIKGTRYVIQAFTEIVHVQQFAKRKLVQNCKSSHKNIYSYVDHTTIYYYYVLTVHKHLVVNFALE